MIDLDEFRRRVDQYFQCGQRPEPGGRLILDLMRALRKAQTNDSKIGKATISELIEEYYKQLIDVGCEHAAAKLVLERFAVRLQSEWSRTLK